MGDGLGDGLAIGADGLPTGAGGVAIDEQPTDIYARLMADHMQALQGSATAGVNQGTRPDGTSTAGRGQSGTLQWSWQDPQIHLMTAAVGRSCAYYDVVYFIGGGGGCCGNY